MSYDEVIKEVAEVLQLEIRTGRDAVALAQSLQTVTQADLKGAEALKDTAMVEASMKFADQATGLLEKFMPGIIAECAAATGEIEGFKAVLARADNETDGLQVVVMFGRDLGLKLHVFKERFTSKLGKVFFRLQVIQLGLEELDPLVMIKAQQEQKARLLLRQPQVQQSLLELYKGTDDVFINDISARAVILRPISTSELRQYTEQLVSLAKAISETV